MSYFKLKIEGILKKIYFLLFLETRIISCMSYFKLKIEGILKKIYFLLFLETRIISCMSYFKLKIEGILKKNTKLDYFVQQMAAYVTLMTSFQMVHGYKKVIKLNVGEVRSIFIFSSRFAKKIKVQKHPPKI